jgi:hypothetical protein
MAHRKTTKRSKARSMLRLADLEQSKTAVLHSLGAASSQESYGHAIDEFIGWYSSEPRLAFNRTVVLRYRFFLEQKNLALSFRKGSPGHVLAGKVFVASMLTMALSAVYLGIVKHQTNNIGGGIITFYLIGTGWLTARRREGETSRMDWVALLFPLAVGILTWMNGIKVVRSGASSQDGVPVGMSFFMGSICLLAAVGDVRVIVRGGVLGVKRIARHLWRMCFGLFIAAGSFFMGSSNRPLRLLSAVGLGRHLPSSLFSTNLYLILSILPLVLLIFWLLRVRFTNAFKGSRCHPSTIFPHHGHSLRSLLSLRRGTACAERFLSRWITSG